jgi:hypothetical protein
MSNVLHLSRRASDGFTSSNEADHRIANSLTVISGLVRVRARADQGRANETFLLEIADRIDTVAKLHRLIAHPKPLRKSTIHGRRAELQAAARVAVKIGVPIEKLNSLQSILKPKVAKKILDAYWQKNGEKPKIYTIDLARRFIAIAKETKCLSEKECEQLWDIWNCLNVERPEEGLTEKNLAFLRKVLTPGVWGRVVSLPFAMMEEARRQRNRPIRAAVIAQLAVAIAIEAVAPVRLENLTSIRLGVNLTKPDGPNSNYWLHFAPEDVKNTVRLQFVFKKYLTELIDE